MVVDLGLPIALLLSVLFGATDFWLLGLGGAIMLAVALRLRHHHPILALIVATLTQMAMLWTTAPLFGAIGVVVVMFSAAVQLPVWQLVIAAIASLIMMGLAETANARMSNVEPNLIPVLLFGGLGLASGVAYRNYRASLLAADAKAQATAKAAAAESRVHLARDLHDSLGHQLAIINIQTEVATAATRDNPTATRALGHVKDGTRAALEELGMLVSALRDGDGPLTPLPDLGQLKENFLATDGQGSFEFASAPTGEIAQVSTRVVQEGLTNARKHAPGSVVDVWVGPTSSGFVATVLNGPGKGAQGSASNQSHHQLDQTLPSPGTGHGITGLRERVEALGGILVAEPTVEGGFRLHAEIPEVTT